MSVILEWDLAERDSAVFSSVRCPFLSRYFVTCYAVAKRQRLQRSGGHMTFDEVLTQVLELLKS